MMQCVRNAGVPQRGILTGIVAKDSACVYKMSSARGGDA